MDRKVLKKNQITKRVLLISLPIIFLGGLFIYSLTKKSTFNVKRSEVSIREAKKGQFEDLLILNGKIEPLNSILINVIEGGSVKEIFVEDGSMIVKGQELLRVHNPNSELNYLQQETSIIEQINNLENTKIITRNQELNLEKELIQIEYDYVDAKQQYGTDAILYNKGVIARRDFEKSTEMYNFQSKRKQIIKTSVAKEKDARFNQIQGINKSLGQIRASLATLRENKENFIIKASESGRLSSFNLALGEHINAGKSIGKIDVLSGYKFVVKVDEFYISKIKKGLEGLIVSNEKKYSLIVDKVLPEVTKGQFTIELIFKDKIPDDLRMGMSFSIRLYLSESRESLLIPKGQFYSETLGNWIFILTNQNQAKRTYITLGRENPTYYEVIKGLKEGDKVITSDYSDFKTSEILNINQ